MKTIDPYIPSITFEDILAFRPDEESTHTHSRLVNAVAKLLFTTNVRDLDYFAEYLQIDKRRLSIVIEVETGISLKELIVNYRLVQIQTYLKDNTGISAAEVAKTFNFCSYHALWRFLQTHVGETPNGKKSHAPKVDNYHQMVKRIKDNAR